MQVDIEEKNVGRKKRDMNGLTCKENDIEKNCCRYPLIVDFEEFKWDWIIAPKNYPSVLSPKLSQPQVATQRGLTSGRAISTGKKQSNKEENISACSSAFLHFQGQLLLGRMSVRLSATKPTHASSPAEQPARIYR